MAGIKERLLALIEREGDIDLSARVLRGIKRAREAGERPREDPTEIDLYICDLCLNKVRGGEVMQCPFCGRWVCLDTCWNEAEGACRSCAGVIRLHREAIQNIKDIIYGIKDIGDGDESPRKRVGKRKGDRHSVP